MQFGIGYPEFCICLPLFSVYFLPKIYVSVSSKPDDPPRVTSGDSHILCAPGVGVSLLCLAGDLSRGLKSK